MILAKYSLNSSFKERSSKSSIDETGNNLSTQRVEIALVSSATLAIPSYFKTAVFWVGTYNSLVRVLVPHVKAK